MSTLQKENELQELKTKKSDYILIGALLLLAFVLFLGTKLYGKLTTQEAQVVVTVDGKEYGRYDLDTDYQETITLENGSYNTFVIKDGACTMIEASCPDQICVNHKAISKNGESIVCLPDKVVIEIESKEESDLDSIAQ